MKYIPKSLRERGYLSKDHREKILSKKVNDEGMANPGAVAVAALFVRHARVADELLDELREENEQLRRYVSAAVEEFDYLYPDREGEPVVADHANWRALRDTGRRFIND